MCVTCAKKSRVCREFYIFYMTTILGESDNQYRVCAVCDLCKKKLLRQKKN